MSILVTGGTGFIGSHTVVALLDEGFEVVVVDNLVNSSEQVISGIEQITQKSVSFYKADIGDKTALNKIMAAHNIEASIHFAALKAVGESAQKPLMYYQNNVAGSINLFEVLQAHHIDKIIFSSSACVYGAPDNVPITETAPLKPINPYGTTKIMVEEILEDLSRYLHWAVINLRYFNPVGAHASGLIGEDPRGIPNNLVPFICQTAAKKILKLKVYGNDYDTQDGTGIRDYIHVMDLARAHVVALKKVFSVSGMHTYNLGTGQGYSVLEVIETFKQVNKVAVPYEIVARRPGDIACCYANPSLALKELGWRAELSLADMLRDAWHWQSKNLA
jgi:UDP-glucose 4-epimerase